MRHLTNMYDPRKPDADVDMHAVRYFHETLEQARERRQQYLSDKVIGKPKATERYSVEELEGMGMVGVYTLEGDADGNL